MFPRPDKLHPDGTAPLPRALCAHLGIHSTCRFERAFEGNLTDLDVPLIITASLQECCNVAGFGRGTTTV